MNQLWKLFPPRALMKLVLLLIAINALAIGLSNSIDGVQYSALIPVGIFGIFIGWIFTYSKWPRREVWSAILASGLLFIFIQTAMLWSPIFDLMRNLREAGIQLLLQVIYKTPADFSVLRTSFMVLMLKAGELVAHLVTWARTPSNEDPLVYEFIWDVPVFVLAAWSIWMLKRERNALIGLAPILALLGYVLYYTGSHSFPLQIAIFVVLLLMGITGWEMHTPKRQGTHSQEKAASDTRMALFLLSLGLAILAGMIPSVSAKELATGVKQTVQKARNREVPEALGLKAVSTNSSETYVTPTLPNQHLIGQGEPSTSRKVIFTAKTGELPPLPVHELREEEITIPRHYWRVITYDIYTGGGWATTLTESERYSADEYIFNNIPQGYRLLDQEIHKTEDTDTRLFWSGHLVLVDKPYETAWRTPPNTVDSTTDSFLSADMMGAITDAGPYHAQSFVPLASADQMRASPQTYPELIQQKYLALPKTVPDRVIDRARDLTANLTNTYDKAEALQTFLRTYPYTLDVPPPPPDRDVADYFLFDLKKGYCDYYATSMVVMARSIGLPARLVTGYASGTYVPTTATYIVHAAEAHSWPEIYFSGIGWVEFEPTASQPEITRPAQPEQEESLPETVLTKPKPEPKDVFNDLIATYGKPLLILATLIFVFLGWFVYRYFWLPRQFENPIAYIYGQLFKQGGKLAINSPVYETPSSFAKRLADRIQRTPHNGFTQKI